MPDENYRVSLRVNNAFGCGNVVCKRYRRILNDRDGVALLPQDVIDAFPTRAVHKTTVDEDNSLCSQTCSFSHDDPLSLGTDFVSQRSARQIKYLSVWPHNTPQIWHCASAGRRLNLNSALQHSPLYMWRLIEVRFRLRRARELLTHTQMDFS